MTDIATLENFFRLMNAHGAMRVYQEALRAGVLPGLAQGPLTPAALAQKCGLAERPTALLLEVLAALGLVSAADGDFQLTPLAQVLLAGSYRDLGDTYWAHLPAFLKTATPVVRMDDPAQSESHYAAQAQALAWMTGPAAACAAEVLRRHAPRRILDLGAGSAIWSLALALQIPGATVTAVDWPAVLRVAEKCGTQMGLADRLTCRAGNYHEIPLEAVAYDLALLANVAHLETEDSLRGLLRRVHAALRPGGHVAIVDVMPGDATGDLNRALYALGLALRTAHGSVHTVPTLQALLADAGFNAAEFHPLPTVPHALGLILAQRG